MMEIQEIEELVDKTIWNKYQKEDVLDLVKEHIEYLDMTPDQLEDIANKLDGEAENLYEEVCRLECEANVIRDLSDVLAARS